MTKLRTLCAAIALVATVPCMAQTYDTEPNIVAQLEATTYDEGTVTIHQDPLLAERIGSVYARKKVRWSGNTAYIPTKGYRIQVLSDNNQQVARREASKRETQLKNYDSSLDTYVTFTSPFWRLRVGNYRSYEEANQALTAMGRKFPKYRGEMRIVEDNIHVVVHTTTPLPTDSTLIENSNTTL